MKIVIADTVDDIGVLAADALLSAMPSGRGVVGLATGSSPLPLYRELGRRHRGGQPMAVERLFALDEYVGLAEGHPQSYRAVLQREVLRVLDLRDDLLDLPPVVGSTLDEIAENATAYDSLIHSAGGVDVQILGIGSNGHIGFNEPGSSFESRTRLAALDERTRADNARFFNGRVEEVPTHCVTQGLATILEARHLLLIASGLRKADAVARALEGPQHETHPASIIQSHAAVTVILDHDSASLLGARTDRFAPVKGMNL